MSKPHKGSFQEHTGSTGEDPPFSKEKKYAGCFYRGHLVHGWVHVDVVLVRECNKRHYRRHLYGGSAAGSEHSIQSTHIISVILSAFFFFFIKIVETLRQQIIRHFCVEIPIGWVAAKTSIQPSHQPLRSFLFSFFNPPSLRIEIKDHARR